MARHGDAADPVSARPAHLDAATNPASVVSVGTSSTTIAAANPNRRALYLCNDGANIIYVRLGASAAVAGQGIRLNASGGSVVIDSYAGEVRGIAVTAATNLGVSEV